MATFNIRGKNIEITQPLREYVEKRVGKITKYFDNVDEISVLLSVERERQIVEVTAEVRGGLILRGQESNADMYTSIDLVVEKLERQIHKQKTKLERRFRNGGIRSEAFAESKIQVEREDEGGEYPIVKTKHFVVKPMDVQEAIMQMNLLNHNFFVFRDAQTEQICVVYKRTAGAYGLLEFDG
ncbi:MAG: ribosome-associated translation inhibitor RaiA [Selenomonadaceae bacterium]|nr:ribosome-associated translation inhibitor RaiA [Selenomonadaceae bacterium]